MMTAYLSNIQTRFWLKVYPRGDCWEWRSTRRRDGYGVFAAWRQMWRAHRLAYLWAKGWIPPDRELDHLCNHPWCVRPSHLVAVSHRENTLRGNSLAARRARQTHCKRGHPFDVTNTYIRPNRGGRTCRTCFHDWYVQRCAS